MLLILRPSCCYLPLGRGDGVGKSDDPDMYVWLKMPCQIVDFVGVSVLKNQHDPHVCLIWGIANCKPQDRMCVFFDKKDLKEGELESTSIFQYRHGRRNKMHR